MNKRAERWAVRRAVLMSPDTRFEVNHNEGARQGYNQPADTARACRRAARYMRNHAGVPPSHIQRGVALLLRTAAASSS